MRNTVIAAFLFITMVGQLGATDWHLLCSKGKRQGMFVELYGRASKSRRVSGQLVAGTYNFEYLHCGTGERRFGRYTLVETEYRCDQGNLGVVFEKTSEYGVGEKKYLSLGKYSETISFFSAIVKGDELLVKDISTTGILRNINGELRVSDGVESSGVWLFIYRDDESEVLVDSDIREKAETYLNAIKRGDFATASEICQVSFTKEFMTRMRSSLNDMGRYWFRTASIEKEGTNCETVVFFYLVEKGQTKVLEMTFQTDKNGTVQLAGVSINRNRRK